MASEPIRGRTSQARPTLAHHAGELHMVFLGRDSDDVLHSVYQGNGDWSQAERIPDRTSSAPPALASHDGELHMAFSGRDSDDVFQSVYQGNGNWTRAERISGRTSRATPGLASHGGTLHMVFLGGSDNILFESRFDERAESWIEANTIPEHKSSRGPSLAPGSEGLTMAHVRPDSEEVWQSVFDPNYDYPECTVEAFQPQAQGERVDGSIQGNGAV